MNQGNRNALIIGASSPGGLGEAVALKLAASGVQVSVAGRRMDPLEALAAKVGGRALPCDITDEASIADAVSEAGPIDILVNAAGTTGAARLAKIERAHIEAQLAVHVTGNMLLLKHASKTLRNGGSVVLFSSLTARVAGEALAAYACAKAAVEQLVRIAALEFGSMGVRVNAVAPGFSKTPMTEGIFARPELRDLYLKECPLGMRSVTPEEVASAVAWLSDELCFVNGEVVQLSGGAQLGRLPRIEEIKNLRSM